MRTVFSLALILALAVMFAGGLVAAIALPWYVAAVDAAMFALALPAALDALVGTWTRSK